MPKELTYRTARASKEVIAKEAEFINTLMESVEDGDRKNSDSVDVDFEIEDDRSKLDRERAQTTVDSTRNFDSAQEVQDMIAPGR